MAVGTEIVNRVMTALEAMTTGAGFATDVQGRVHRGRPENLTIERDDLPMIAVSTQESNTESLRPDAAAKQREITIDGLVAATGRDYEPDLDDMDEDLARALSALTRRNALPGATKVTVSGGQYNHPDSGSNVAGVTYTVTVSYALTLSA